MVLRVQARWSHLRPPGCHRLWPAFPEPFDFVLPSSCLALQPPAASSQVWASPFSLATTQGIVSFPPGTEMFQFPGFPSTGYVFTCRCAGMPPRGFPHSDISGSTGAHPLPELLAVYRVLRRRLAPRHPPCALSSLSTCDAEKLMFSRYCLCTC